MGDEIVCETEYTFRANCETYGARLLFHPQPGERVVVTGHTIVYRPTPRDEGGEAFCDWFRASMGWRGGAQFGVMDMEAAFLAGRASVKP